MECTKIFLTWFYKQNFSWPLKNNWLNFMMFIKIIINGLFLNLVNYMVDAMFLINYLLFNKYSKENLLEKLIFGVFWILNYVSLIYFLSLNIVTTEITFHKFSFICHIKTWPWHLKFLVLLGIYPRAAWLLNPKRDYGQ